MARYRYHPRRNKACVFCNNWMGRANSRYIDSYVGYEFDSGASGECTKKNGSITTASSSCSKYEPGMDARRLL